MSRKMSAVVRTLTWCSIMEANCCRLPVGQQRRRIVWQKGFGLDGPKPILAGLIDEAAGMKSAAPPRDELYKPRAARVSQSTREVHQGRGVWALLRSLHSIRHEHQHILPDPELIPVPRRVDLRATQTGCKYQA